MAASARYISDTSIDFNALKDIYISDRTISVDLKTIKAAAIKLMGSHEIALLFATKVALRGQKIKPSDTIKFNGTMYKTSELLDRIKKQNGYTDNGATLGRDSDKSLVSVARIRRAFASEIAKVIKAKKVLPEDTEVLRAKNANLPIEYAFIDSVYGMDDETVSTNGSAYCAFCMSFDEHIAEMYKAGYCEGTNKRSHYENAVNYLKWRGFEA